MGFLLDSGSCIGCHACTVACKSEHDVPLGVNRTWVKYIETGTFPDVARKFNVMRCNQCDDAPCMKICPTSALFRTDNGVVDFADARCIGCKSCMNACPYDALHINPQTNTAQKCNMCNHRLEEGLLPSCQIVCPTEAIKIGDLSDPDSEISRIVARHPVQVRAPEQNTQPKVFYLGADQASLEPTRSAIANDGLIWADTLREDSGRRHPTVPVALGTKPTEVPGVVATTTYTTAHMMTWKEKVSGYLVTKAIAAGAMLIASLLVLLAKVKSNQPSETEEAIEVAIGWLPPVVAGVFLAVTGFLLIADLKQPRRFHYLITKGNFDSWLVKGAYVLMAFAAVCAVWFFAALTGSRWLISAMAIPAVAGALGTAGYTAFLFGQCEGRDLWQSPLLLPILLAQAVIAGGSVYLIANLFVDVVDLEAIVWSMLGGLGAVGLLVAVELSSKGSRHVELAVEAMTRGTYRWQFWGGAVLVGLVVPFLLAAAWMIFDLHDVILACSSLGALVGMFAYEDAFVRAGQSVPLS